MNKAPPQLVIVSGPSGAGKSSVLRMLLERCELPLRMSVSATTREPRPTERDGVDYYFLTRDEFQRRRAAGEFLECKEVFGAGHWYGTLREQVASGLQAGKWVILEIDVEGAAAVLEQEPEAVTIFVHPGAPAELERRLRSRGTETEGTIQRRLAAAEREMAAIQRYQHEVLNGDGQMEQAAESICQILTSLSNR